MKIEDGSPQSHKKLKIHKQKTNEMAKKTIMLKMQQFAKGSPMSRSTSIFKKKEKSQEQLGQELLVKKALLSDLIKQRNKLTH